MKKIVVSLTFLLFVGVIGLWAQKAVTTSGGNASGSGGSVSYSVGQIVYTTYANANGSVAQGVQQPYEISVVTGIEEAIGLSLEVSVYPNPAQDFVTLKIKNYDIPNLRYGLYDINGSLLQDKKVEDNESILSMQNLLPGSYILKVTDNNKVRKTFKIIKN